MGWRVLDLTHLYGELSFSKRTRKLLVTEYETAEISEFSPEDINIIFSGIGVGMAPGVISHLVKHGVVVLYCDWKGCPLAGLYPWVDSHGRIVARQRAQAGLSTPRAKNAWMRIVKAKIRGQASNLDALGKDGGERLRKIAAKTTSGDPANCEALAARCYWSRLLGVSFKRRPGIGTDKMNSMLDYGYTILRGYCIRAILAAGLAPTLGVFHRGRGNSFALADDLIEPFRPKVDFTVAGLAETDGVADSEVRQKLQAVAIDEFLPGQGGIQNVLSDFAQQYGRYVESEIKFLPVPVWTVSIDGRDCDA